MTTPSGETVTVSEESDVILSGRQAKEVLAELEFDEPAVEEIVLVVRELASNIVKHAGEGSITLVSRSNGGRSGIEIRAHDSGPGIADIDRAIVDGYSTVGGLGGGLGTVHRLMDEVTINSDGDRETGVQLVATRWSTSSSADQPTPPLVVGAATRAKPGYDQNGDAFLIEHRSGRTLVGVIDGLGHGQAAHRAASRAQRYIRAHSAQPLDALFAGVERVCRDTRGVVMLLARFDWAAGTVTLGSVGNITVRVCDSPTSPHVLPERGVLGSNAPNPQIEEWDWDPASVMVIHSDGLTSRWQCDEFALRYERPVADTANELLRTLSNQEDDATVLVISGVDR